MGYCPLSFRAQRPAFLLTLVPFSNRCGTTTKSTSFRAQRPTSSLTLIPFSNQFGTTPKSTPWGPLFLLAHCLVSTPFGEQLPRWHIAQYLGSYTICNGPDPPLANIVHFRLSSSSPTNVGYHKICYSRLNLVNKNMNRVYDPIVYGDYPKEMQAILGSQLPRFSKAEKKVLKGSLDYIYVNHYTTLYTKDCLHSICSDDANRPIKGFLDTTGYRDGVSIGDPVCSFPPYLLVFIYKYNMWVCKW